jgi:hypothetical protein
MAEGVVTSDGKLLDLDAARERIDRDFATAMAEPTGEEKAPPKRAPREPVEPPEDKPRVTRTGKRVGRPPGSASSAAKPPKAAAPVVTHGDRVQAVQGLVQLVAVGCVMVSQRVPDPVPFQADAATLAGNSEQLGEAVAVTCDQDERLAALVDKIAVAGPYAALITAVFGVGMQVARNHGVPVPGTVDPKELVDSLSEAKAA